MAEYGELNIGGIQPQRNLVTGRFMKGHTPTNKGKKWSDYMGKRAQKRAARGWKNLEKHRNKNGRPDTAGRCRKQVIAVFDNDSWLIFPYVGAAAEWVGGNRENVSRCCRYNQSRKQLKDTHGRPSGKVNTDHRYKGIRWYYETDNAWTAKIK